jgi:hypothetical protein
MTPNHNYPARLFGYRLAEVKRNSDRQLLAEAVQKQFSAF